MPIYIYQCENCGKIIERLTSVRNSEERIIECPKCKRKTSHKIPSLFNSAKINNVKASKFSKKDTPENQKSTEGPTINMAPYSGIHIDETVKNFEMSNLTIKKDDTSSISVHPKAKARIKKCKISEQN